MSRCYTFITILAVCLVPCIGVLLAPPPGGGGSGTVLRCRYRVSFVPAGVVGYAVGDVICDFCANGTGENGCVPTAGWSVPGTSTWITGVRIDSPEGNTADCQQCVAGDKAPPTLP